MVDVAEEFDRGGGVLGDSHGGGELLGELGMGSLLGTAGGRLSGGSRRRLTRSCATAPSPGAARGAEHDSLGTVGERQPGEGRELLGSFVSAGMQKSFIGFSLLGWRLGQAAGWAGHRTGDC